MRNVNLHENFKCSWAPNFNSCFFFFGTGKSLEFSLVKKFFYQISAFTAILFDIGLPSLEFNYRERMRLCVYSCLTPQ